MRPAGGAGRCRRGGARARGGAGAQGGPGAGRGGARRAVRPVPWEPGGPVDAHGFQPGAAGGGRFLRRFPPAEPGAGAARAAAALGPAQPLEVAQHLDIAGAQRAQRRRGAGRVLPPPRAVARPGEQTPARGAQPGRRVCRLFPRRLCGYVVQSETSSVLGAALSSLCGNHLLWHCCAAPPVRGLRPRGFTGGDQLHLPAPAADPADGQPGAHHLLPPQQPHQPGHLRAVPHGHAGLDVPLALPQPPQRAPRRLRRGHAGHGNHDPHERRPPLPPAAE